MKTEETYQRSITSHHLALLLPLPITVVSVFMITTFTNLTLLPLILLRVIERQSRETTMIQLMFFIDDVQGLYTRGTATMLKTRLFEGAFRLCRFPHFGNRPCGISGDYYLINI
jgi:hypothetical protein